MSEATLLVANSDVYRPRPWQWNVTGANFRVDVVLLPVDRVVERRDFVVAINDRMEFGRLLEAVVEKVKLVL